MQCVTKVIAEFTMIFDVILMLIVKSSFFDMIH